MTAKTSLFNAIYYGTKLSEKMHEDDTEYNRRVPLLITLAYFAIIMLSVFSLIDLIRGDGFNAVRNLLVLACIVAGFIHLRMTGKTAFASNVFLCMICIQFFIDFAIDNFRAMWSFSVPLLFFFMLGIRNAAVATTIFFLAECGYMFVMAPQHFPTDFKIRFPIIFFCIALFSSFFEWVRFVTQNKLERSRSMFKIQSDIGVILGSEEHLAPALDRMLDAVLVIKEIDSGWVYLVDKKTGALDLAVCRGLTAEFARDVSRCAPDSFYTTLVMKGAPVFQRCQETGLIHPDAKYSEGLKGMAVLPILNEAKVIAVLNLASHSSDEFPLETQRLLESISASLGNAIARMIAIDELRKLSVRNDAILSAVPDIIMETDNNKVYKWANKAGIDFFGRDVVGKGADAFFEGEQETYIKTEPLFSGSDELIYVESMQRRKDGEKRLLAWWCRSLKDLDGRVTGALSSARDITDMRKLEQQLRQAHKMDAIGQLAGGIAHDFNNQLTAIAGFAQLLSQNAGENQQMLKYAEKIMLTAKRSSDLTAQLLAFSRKGNVISVATDLRTIIAEVVEILKHTIDKKIILKQRLGVHPMVVQCDPSQIQNALLNIALNARDAMPDGGDMVFATEKVKIDRSYAVSKHFEIHEGTYILVSVTDTGSGMDADTQKHIFEPFFTTKEIGKGTGMGLAAVYGIVKSHRGWINVYSEPGYGTACKLYFPAFDVEAAGEKEKKTSVGTAGQKLRILFIDDEKMIGEMAHDMLASLGHEVSVFNSAKKAVEHYKKSWQSIDLVIMDMIMPEMGGMETFVALQAINPSIRSLLSSGYSLAGEAQKIINKGVRGFVQKPFMFDQLQKAIEDAMTG
ncbi:MAG TPA: response regulator [Chitinivibrionales bacterium]|nr:response regulator [Chitinivibrionales bacterium]